MPLAEDEMAALEKPYTSRTRISFGPRVLTRGQREISTMRGAYVLVLLHPPTIGLRIRHEFETTSSAI